MDKNKLRIFILKNASRARRNKIIQLGMVPITKTKDSRRITLAKKMDKAIETFAKDADRKSLEKAIWKDVVTYLIDPEEYFLYGFEYLNDEQKHSFVGNREKELICGWLNHLPENHDAWKVFMDKWLTYEAFKPYYQREAIHITSSSDKDAFIAFCKKHKTVITKVSNSSQGRGISRISASDDLDVVFSKMEQSTLTNGGTVVVEEVVNQSEIMSVFNESSVNTVRITTFRKDDEIVIMFAFMRTGRKGAVVDNGGSGGLLIGIDEKIGECNAEGCDEEGHRYRTHPDSGVEFIGFKIPEWDKAVTLAKELATVIPEQRYVGWDLAYTDVGWVMIEGNSWSQFVGPQISQRRGMRSFVDRTFYEYLKM
jgi:hypothetical protein